MTGRIRVILADDHALFRLGLKTLLAAEPDIDVIAEAANGREALQLCAELAPDIVIMDLAMAGLDGVTATGQVVANGSSTRVLVLTMYEEEEYLIPVIEAGASGYLVKSAAGKELVEAVRTVMAGEVYLRAAAGPVLAKGWTRRDAQGEARELYIALSERERTVLRLVAEGYSPSQIGERLSISPKTVDTYRRRIGEKTGLTERPEYVQLALELGLLKAPPA